MPPAAPAATTPIDESAPLFVDLDGTLIRGDSLWESLAFLARENVLACLGALLSILKGRAALKKAVAAARTSDGREFIYHDAVLAFVRETSKTRPVILATAADQRIAEAVSGHIGAFEGVIASDGEANAKGADKLNAIKAYLRARGRGPTFDYIGDASADRPLWREARQAFVVAPNDEAARALMGDGEPTRVFTTDKRPFRAFLRGMRVYQWVKNALIFLPLLLSHQYTNADKLTAAMLAFFAMSLTASATYLWNDLLDLQADRAHPRKRLRPFASGALPIPLGVALSGVLLAIAIAICLLLLPPVTALLVLGYIAMTLSYSFYLKRRLLVDAITLGVLYGYRIVIGAVVTSIAVSDWLIAFSIFFFFGLALVKRFSEVLAAPDDASERVSGRGYFASDRDIVSMLGVASSFTSVLIMALYVTSPAIIALYERPRILWLVCLVMIYWLARVWVLAHRGFMPDDPIVFALKDRNSIACGAICAAAVLLAV